MKTFDPDDPMLTAFALGELEGEELREVEELIARDPAAARHVESIRAATAAIGEAFEREPAPAVEPIRAVEIEPAQERRPFVPWLFYASTAVAACFFIVLIVRLADPTTLTDRKQLAAEASVTSKKNVAPAAETQDLARQAESLGKEKAEADALAGAAEMKSTPLAGDSTGAGSNAAAATLDKVGPVGGLGRKGNEAGALADAVAGKEATMEKLSEDAGMRAVTAVRQRRDSDAPVAAAPAATSPPPPLGEMKMMAKSEPEPSRDEEAIALSPIEVSAKDALTSGGLARLSPALADVETGKKVDTAGLLAELGYHESPGIAEDELGNLAAQTTAGTSPEHDPEAALLRAVQGFAQLVEGHTPASDEAWDRVLADARFAAGTNEKRLEFVHVIEEARKAAHAPEAH